MLAFAGQVPLQNHLYTQSNRAIESKTEFAFKEGASVFTPKDLVALARPGEGVSNDAGDLVLVPVSKYSLDEKKCVPCWLFFRYTQTVYTSRNKKSIFITPLEPGVQPLHIPLAEGGDAFWLDSRTVAHVVKTGEGKNKRQEIYALSIEFKTDAVGTLDTVNPPTFIGALPTSSAANFRYSRIAGYLVFSDYVYPDGNLTVVKEKDDEWENRGTTALVYDSGYPRHWDHWIGPKSSSLFVVRLAKNADGKWELGTEFVNPLAGTGHASSFPSINYSH
jgi:hypothetical protein